MTDEFESALRRALRRRSPDGEFSERVVSRLEHGTPAAPPVRREAPRRRALRSGWLPLALAASLIAAVGLVQLRQQSIEAARASRARAQLLQALSIASTNINIVRDAVAREENPDS